MELLVLLRVRHTRSIVLVFSVRNRGSSKVREWVAVKEHRSSPLSPVA